MDCIKVCEIAIASSLLSFSPDLDSAITTTN
ncbi:hypothetical protein NIES21_31500 [Anabaenopsis circularis NIES-21]|uniref:Uncharacterized protein n=1 Tax=Anabaenopsis circularis NIES-21 TaxID=1085406 RepID=A0A1Z4GIG5_9CYAN|nr:hypothetical protein NIES21_31500 [Anabaenopsis circularis NIES-21]